MSRIKTEERIIQLVEEWYKLHTSDEPPTDCFAYRPLGLAPVNEEPIYFLFRYDDEKKEMCKLLQNDFLIIYNNFTDK